MTRSVVRRAVHPVAWWLWALALAAAASRTLNPLLLLGIIAVAGLVVAARRTDAPWAGAFRAFLLMGAFVLVVRVVFEVLFGPPIPGTIILTLPSVTLPTAMAGVRLGGAVTAEALVTAIYSGLQLVAIFACVGAANALANPTRLLKSVPGALYEVGVAVVVALTLVPTAVTHAQQVREARRLRGRTDKGIRAIASVSVTVMEGALERSLELAAAMDSRGYGRTRHIAQRQRRITSACLLAGLVALLVGSYGLLDAETPGWAALMTMTIGGGIALLGLRRANRRAVRTVYRADPWRSAEWLTVVCGVIPAVALGVVAATNPGALLPVTSPLVWPELPVVPLVAILIAAGPAWATPRPPLATSDIAPVLASHTTVKQEAAA